MRSLTDYHIANGVDFTWKSDLCGLASTLHCPDIIPLSLYINELCLSYYNQWQLIMDAYDELYHLHQKLSALNDESETPNEFSPYDLASVDLETRCRDYSHLFIISIKSLLDLIACLVDAIVCQQEREESKMMDIGKFKNPPANRYPTDVVTIMNSLSNSEQYPWLVTVWNSRDKLIHRGYRLKPQFSFKKENDLTMSLVKGNSRDETVHIKIGELFQAFITDLPKIETLLKQTLIGTVPELARGQKVEMEYTAGGGVARYDLHPL